MSHGCINMRIEDAAIVYAWANPVIEEGGKYVRANKENQGTRIVITGKASMY